MTLNMRLNLTEEQAERLLTALRAAKDEELLDKVYEAQFKAFIGWKYDD